MPAALRTVKEYYEKVECTHLNPARAGLVKGPEDCPVPTGSREKWSREAGLHRNRERAIR